MTTNPELDAAILGRPHDDTPRLVLADWLDDNPGDVECPACRGKRYCPRCSGEGCSPYGVAANGPCLTDRCATCQSTGYVSNGNAQWAEFIRTQVELARLPDEPFIRVAEAVLAERQSRMSRLERNESRDILLPKCFPEARAIVAERDAKRLELRRWERGLWLGAYHSTNLHRWFPVFGPGQLVHRDECVVSSSAAISARALVRRGFVDEVRLPLASLVGESLRDRRRGHNSCCNRHADMMACDCKDTPGLARELFAAHPITRVVLTDREPRLVSDSLSRGWTWSQERTGIVSPHAVPDAIRDILSLEGGQRLIRDYKRWDTRDAALQALSDACVAYGRELAGLRSLNTHAEVPT